MHTSALKTAALFFQVYLADREELTIVDIGSQDVTGSIAVGTTLSSGPPHRSQRAGLPHWAPALSTSVEAYIWERMLHTDRR